MYGAGSFRENSMKPAKSLGAAGPRAVAAPSLHEQIDSALLATPANLDAGLCTDTDHGGCAFTGACTMFSVWRLGQHRMLEVYRHAKLDKLAMTGLVEDAPAIAEAPVIADAVTG